MKTLIFVLFISFCSSVFAEKLYERELFDVHKKAMQNKKIKCRWVCDKKIYKEQKIAEAISFYKKSKYYTFDKKEF